MPLLGPLDIMAAREVILFKPFFYTSNKYVYLVLILMLLFAIVTAAVLSLVWLILLLPALMITIIIGFLKR